MPYLWIPNEDQWTVADLRREVALIDRPPYLCGASDHKRDFAWLLPATGLGRDVWALLTTGRPRLAVNGLRLTTGARRLDHRDEISGPWGGRLYFSSERLATIERGPRRDSPLMCPRCRQPIEAGEPAVCCPGCEVWHHLSDDLPCWTYATTCAVCVQPSTVGEHAALQWLPTRP